MSLTAMFEKRQTLNRKQGGTSWETQELPNKTGKTTGKPRGNIW